MNYKKIHFFDMEMCCWDDGRKPNVGEIIEISFATLDIEKMEIISTNQFYVKPEKDEISEKCFELTNISQSKINKVGRPLKDVIKTIKNKVGGKKAIFASWGRDDLYLQKECENKNIDCHIIECINVETLFGLKHKVGGNSFGLDSALNKYGLSFEGQKHSALDDAINLARLFVEMNKNE